MKKLTKIVLLVVVLALSLVLATACETLKNHEHKPVAEWSSDGTNHYHACTFKGCTEKLDSTACAGGKATCQVKATCDTCGTQYGALGQHVYNLGYATEEFLKTPATCTERAFYYKSCACGAKGTETFQAGETAPHVYDQKVATVDYLKSPATWISAAVYKYSCECGEEGTETFTSGDPRTPLVKLDFEDGAGSGTYKNASWAQEQYNNDGWGALTNQMNSRSKEGVDGVTSNIVNFVCYQGMSRRFTYTLGSTLASVNYVSIDLGNYFDGAKEIKIKIVLIDADGNSHYLIDSNGDWVTFNANNGLVRYQFNLTTAVNNVVAIRVVTQGTSGNQYLYCDNIVLDYVA